MCPWLLGLLCFWYTQKANPPHSPAVGGVGEFVDCCIIGKECHQILKNLPLTAAERKDPCTILDKLTNHFEPKRNTIYERYVFNSCIQSSEDNFDSFLNILRALSASCEFGALKDEMIT